MNEETQQQVKIETEQNDTVEKLQLDDLTKAVAVLVGSLYVVGVLATNTYLYSLGVTDYSLLKARYIYTGALVLFPVFLSILAPIFGLHYFRVRLNIEPDESSSSFDRWFLSLMNSRLTSWEMLIIGCGLPFVTFLFFTFKHEEGDLISAIGLALWMYIVCFGAGLFGTMAIAATLPKAAGMRLQQSLFPRSNQKKTNTQSKIMNEPPNWITAFGLTLFTIGYFAYYLSLFGAVILTKVPEQFGGAKPHQAHLLFKSDAVEGARQLGINIPEQSLVSQELTILFEGENIVVVRRFDEHILQLSKDMLQAVDVNLSQH